MELAWTSWGGLGGMQPFDLGGSTPSTAPFGLGGTLPFDFAGGTPVPPLELGYPTPFVRAIGDSWYASTLVSLF